MGNKKNKKEKRPFWSKMFFIVLIFCLVLIYSRYIGTSGLKIREYNIIDDAIPQSFDGFSIVQFSDLEFGSTFLEENLKTLVNKINSLRPQVVVFTGDLISSGYNLSKKEKNKIINALNDIDPLIGKYSIRGDDDVSSKFYEDIITSSGFIDITNDYELIYYKGLTPIVLYGLDSMIKGNPDYDKTFSYPDENTDPTYMATYRILLAHEPDSVNDIGKYNVSLMLSGHSHNSEINLPYLKKLYKLEGATNYYDEKYEVDGTQLYISSGLGTSKLKMRLFSKPSISIFRLYTE